MKLTENSLYVLRLDVGGLSDLTRCLVVLPTTTGAQFPSLEGQGCPKCTQAVVQDRAAQCLGCHVFEYH